MGLGLIVRVHCLPQALYHMKQSGWWWLAERKFRQLHRANRSQQTNSVRFAPGGAKVRLWQIGSATDRQQGTPRKPPWSDGASLLQVHQQTRRPETSRNILKLGLMVDGCLMSTKPATMPLAWWEVVSYRLEVINQRVFAFDPRLIRLILEPHKTLILTLEPEKVPKHAFWRIVETCSRIYKDKNYVFEEIPLIWVFFSMISREFLED